MLKSPSDFYFSQNEPNKSCFLALRDIILNQNKKVTETLKYNMPCFCFTKKPICYLWTDKKTGEPYILFVEGKHLQHPELESGNRARMKILRVNPSHDIPKQTIERILIDALELYH